MKSLVLSTWIKQHKPSFPSMSLIKDLPRGREKSATGEALALLPKLLGHIRNEAQMPGQQGQPGMASRGHPATEGAAAAAATPQCTAAKARHEVDAGTTSRLPVPEVTGRAETIPSGPTEAGTLVAENQETECGETVGGPAACTLTNGVTGVAEGAGDGLGGAASGPSPLGSPMAQGAEQEEAGGPGSLEVASGEGPTSWENAQPDRPGEAELSVSGRRRGRKRKGKGEDGERMKRRAEQRERATAAAQDAGLRPVKLGSMGVIFLTMQRGDRSARAGGPPEQQPSAVVGPTAGFGKDARDGIFLPSTCRPDDGQNGICGRPCGASAPPASSSLVADVADATTKDEVGLPSGSVGAELGGVARSGKSVGDAEVAAVAREGEQSGGVQEGGGGAELSGVEPIPLDCVSLLHKRLQAGSLPPLQFCCRILPVLGTCAVATHHISSLVQQLAKQTLAIVLPPEHTGPIRYAVAFKRRGLPAGAEPGGTEGARDSEGGAGRAGDADGDDRQCWIAAAAKGLEQGAEPRVIVVDLQNPEVVVAVEVVGLAQGQPFCALSLLPRWLVEVKPRLAVLGTARNKQK